MWEIGGGAGEEGIEQGDGIGGEKATNNNNNKYMNKGKRRETDNNKQDGDGGK